MTSLSPQQERAQILTQIAQINSMIRGKLSQQTLKRKRPSGTASYGPYYTLQRHENGTNNCQRVAPQDVPFVAEAVQGYARFLELTRRYAQLTEQLTWERQSAPVKKKYRQFSKPTSPKPSSA
jgi:hypothetical protein